MKAILIIDMPENCRECAIHQAEYGNSGNIKVEWCGLHTTNSLGRVDTQNTKPEWCPLKSMPLKPMPKEKNRSSKWVDISDAIDKSYINGWNDCLKEIEK